MGNFTKFEGFGVFGIFLGLCGLGYSAWQTKKMTDATKKIDLALEDVVKKTPVEVEQSIVEKAVQIAVDRAVTDKANTAVADIKRDIHGEIEKQVRREVNDITSDIKDRVAEEAKDQLDHIDKDTIVKEATRKVIEELRIEGRKELNHQLNGVISDLSSNLSAYKQVYDGVKGALNYVRPANEGKEVSFRIG